MNNPVVSTSNRDTSQTLRMSPSGTDTFRTAVRYILTEWPSLNLAVENGMGGSQAREIREWMCKTVADAVLKDKDIDIEDYLAEIINQEFDTIIEDGSLEYNSQWINKFYRDCLQGNEQDVRTSIEQAAKKKVSLGNMQIPKPVCQTQESSEDDDEDEDEEE